MFSVIYSLSVAMVARVSPSCVNIAASRPSSRVEREFPRAFAIAVITAVNSFGCKVVTSLILHHILLLKKFTKKFGKYLTIISDSDILITESDISAIVISYSVIKC